jgi:hypothetical protein
MVEQQQEISDDEAILKIAQAMKGNVSTPEDKQSVHVFLHNVATAPKTTKVGNLRDDKDMNELGVPTHNVRGTFDMARISDKIMDNEYFKEYFEDEAESTLATSLSREGFLVRQAVTQTKQVADITRRRKINKGWFGKQKIDESGGETTGYGQGK